MLVGFTRFEDGYTLKKLIPGINGDEEMAELS
jgi:hypothetical protein